mmetsp:Transcript_41114/g.131535  ORF Transcript_41114/g.131535 Transcript_41114/m.131535 type:complete len:511 (-) Transcript_41114:101-1633(-)
MARMVVIVAAAACLLLSCIAPAAGVSIFLNGQWVGLHPEVQNIPEDPAMEHLRPPKPILLPVDQRTMFIGLSGFRDATRCGNTIFTAFKQATRPELLSFGIVDQADDRDKTCINEFCRLSTAEWPLPNGECRYKHKVSVRMMKAVDSRGPTLARSYQQELLKDEEFCLQLDAHSVFTPEWDVDMMRDWVTIDNEMAVISTYIQDIEHIDAATGRPKNENQHPHLCNNIMTPGGLYRNQGANSLLDSDKPGIPQMSALWGAGLSFSKCHAERRAPVDPHTPWLFDGEEFLRASHLWTRGYDMYSPTKGGTRIFHNYTKVPFRFESVSLSAQEKQRLQQLGRNRFWLEVGVPFEGMVDARDMPKYGYGHVRTFDQYLEFAGFQGKLSEITSIGQVKFKSTCRQLHWIPYDDPREVEQLLHGTWKQGAPLPAAGGGAVLEATAGAGGEGRSTTAPLPAAQLESQSEHDGDALEAAMVEVAQERAIAAILAHLEALVLLIIILVFVMRLRVWRG